MRRASLIFILVAAVIVFAALVFTRPDSVTKAPQDGNLPLQEQPQQSVTPTSDNLPLSPDPTDEPVGDGENGDVIAFPSAVEAVRRALAAELLLDAETIEVASFGQAEWPNSCLGLAGEQEVCLQVITPGYFVTVRAEGKTLRYRTNSSGSAVRKEQ